MAATVRLAHLLRKAHQRGDRQPRLSRGKAGSRKRGALPERHEDRLYRRYGPINYGAVFRVLDRARAKHADMILLHGGSPRGAELIAAKWADAKGVPQVVFRPDWANHGKAAPFKRNDILLQELPVGVIAFPGSGITENLVDKGAQARDPGDAPGEEIDAGGGGSPPRSSGN
ncbi:MAG: hypothetical protein AcusKO_02730 [Acuticoccus sp.]